VPQWSARLPGSRWSRGRELWLDFGRWKRKQYRHTVRHSAGARINCGTPILLTLTATLSNGSPFVAPISVTVGSPVAAIISGTLSLTPPTGAGFTSIGGTKTGTLARAGGQSTCAVVKSAPTAGTGASTTTGGRYAAFTFTNPNAASQCVTVRRRVGLLPIYRLRLSTTAALLAATSLASGTNYLADSEPGPLP